MPVTKVSCKASVVLTRTIEHIDINERFVAVRVTQAGKLLDRSPFTRKRFASSLAGHTTEMIMSHDNLKKLLAGHKYKTVDMHAVSLEFLESARTKGYTRAVELHQAEFDRNSATVFERLEAGETLRMVRFDYSGNMLFDDQDNVLPIGLYYDYMNGNMRNGAYDLPKALEIINTLADIHVLNKDNAPLSIKAVPYYNVSPGCSSFIEFVYGPTQEQMTAIWEKARSMSKTYPSTMLREAAFELDTLGLRAGGAAKYNTYYDSDSESASSDEDDDNDDNY